MYKLAFLIPHYNHIKKLPNLVEKLKEFGCFILVVDDGSNDDYKAVLDSLGVCILYREKNGGKGAAVKSGFEYLYQNGFTHALQIDADMQHEISKIPEFIKLSQNNQNALICANPIYSQDAPKSRLYGRKITNFWVAINTLSLKIKDSMCGFRLYPLEAVNLVIKDCKSDAMDFDIDIFYLLYKARVVFVWLDVKVFYDLSEVSHFRGFKDNLLISKIHAKHFFGLPKFIYKRLKNG